jgi:trimethylamine--corrinoid protein Co-methyltransferase
MGEVLGIPNWFNWGALCFAHPLRFDRDVADKFVRRAKEGVSAGLTAMPIAGCSTPATVEGFIVVSTAEHVATWLAARALNPKLGLGGSMWAGTVDMATGRVSYNAFDAMYYAFASVEFIRRWIGIEVAVGGGEYCDAREPGMFAVCEKAYKAMTIAAFTGRHPGIGSGMLECGKVMAPVQLMLERDFSQGAGSFARKVDPTRSMIGMDAICEVGLCLDQNHLMTEHTVEHFRSSLWLPRLIERGGWRGAEGDKAMLDKAQAQIDDMLSQYRKPEGREDQLAKMRAVVERAKQKLL